MELVKTQLESPKNIKIEKITMWDGGSGNSENGNRATANFVEHPEINTT